MATSSRRGLESTASNPMTGRVAEMKPTPRSPRLGAFADAMLAVRDFINKAQIPQGVPLIGGEGLGSLILGRAPEELIEMSYGNMPVRVNPMAGRTASFVPEVKPGRSAQVADLLSLAGVPGGGRMAAAATGGLADFGTGAERAMLAYHGTPHRFERFDASKIGTGEGAQAYGHGIYFAESPDVAKSYAVPRGVPDVEGMALRQGIETDRDMRVEIMRQAAADRDPLEAAKFLQYANIKARGLPKEKLAEVITEYRASQQPAFYTVDIPDEMIPRMLDWDKPLAKQSDAVYNAFRKAYQDKHITADPNSPTGTLMLQLQQALGAKGATDYLRESGIPGIRYLDASSRGTGQGTSNFVVFPGEEQRVQILKRE
jgi:hypothetical protein